MSIQYVYKTYIESRKENTSTVMYADDKSVEGTWHIWRTNKLRKLEVVQPGLKLQCGYLQHACSFMVRKSTPRCDDNN